MLEGAAGTVRALTFAAAGQRTFVAQPNFSISQIMRADESSWPRRTPWRADVGYAWWRLCHDSPMESTASAATLRLSSVVVKGRRPTMWQIELTPQVTWWSRAIRTRPAHTNALMAPTRVPDIAQPMPNGTASETMANAGNFRPTATRSGSRRMSGA